MSAGYVYILANPMMPGVVKIGRTIGCPSARARELRSTGVPGDFEVVAWIAVENCHAVEGRIHAIFVDSRVRGREFFQVSQGAAIAALDAFGDVETGAIAKVECHRETDLVARPVERIQALELQPAPKPMASADADDHAVRFIAAQLRHAPGRTAAIEEIHDAYLTWCSHVGEPPAPVRDFMPALSKALMGLGVRGVMIDGRPHANSVRLLSRPALPAPEMVA